LRYSSKPEARRQVSDAQQIAKVLRAGAIVLASIPAIDMMELQVVSGTEAQSGLVRIPTTPSGPTPEVASAAAIALVNGECKDFTGPKPVTIDCEATRAAAPKKAKEKEAPSGWPPDRPPRGQWIAGLTLVSAGGAGLLASYGLLIARRDVGNVVVDQTASANPSDTTNQNKWVNLGSGIVATSAMGGALTVAAMPLVLPYRSKTPWWAWLSGGLGVGAAVGSIVSGVKAPSAPNGYNSRCDNGPFQNNTVAAQTCVDRWRGIDRAIALGATAAPLLTMPLVYLLRKDEKKHGATVTPNLALGPSGGWVSVEGKF
jgi:hypothetical protein